MHDETTEHQHATREAIVRLLHAELDDVSLQEQLTALALEDEEGFAQQAAVWAPALYHRNAVVFGPFLAAYLTAKQHKVIASLLHWAERDRNDELFSDLYQLITTEKTWKQDVLRLAKSRQENDEVLGALQRREDRRTRHALEDHVAAILYSLSPDRFTPYVRDHLTYPWRSGKEHYTELRARALRRGDHQLAWELFRAYGTEREWRVQVRRLIAADTPADAIAAELAQRQVTRDATLTVALAMALVRKYRHAIVPYLQHTLSHAPTALLDQVKALGDEDLYWAIVFAAGDTARWNAAVRALLAQARSDEQLADMLRAKTPPTTTRHGWRLEPEVAQALFARNSVLFHDFLDRFAPGGMAALELPGKIRSALTEQSDRGELLRTMKTLAQEPSFEEHTRLWALALYERDPLFFEPFLSQYLGNEHPEIVKDLLARAEAAGQDDFFRALYRKVTDEATWNKELPALIQSSLSGQDLLKAVERRSPRDDFDLKDEVATALYLRDPTLFKSFVHAHVSYGWGWERGKSTRREYPRLRAAVRAHGDAELTWILFREFADAEEWQAVLRPLLAHPIAPNLIVAELTKRHPEHVWDADPSLMGDFIDTYGVAVLPYIQDHLTWIARKGGVKLLSRVKKLGDETLYWAIFFKVGDAKAWNTAVRELVARPFSIDTLAAKLAMITPPEGESHTSHWTLAEDNALALYARDRERFMPWLIRFGDDAYADTLFEQAEAARDESLLDHLTLPLLQSISSWLDAAFPTPSQQRWRKPSLKAQDKVRRVGAMITARFDRLVAEAPASYVQHAANTLANVEAYQVWSFKRNVMLNPAFAYLFRECRTAWQADTAAIRDLLESPNIYVQILGLTLLNEENALAAARVIENLPLIRALLLGRAHKSTKRLAVQVLDRAARQGQPFAERILPLLEETAYLTGKQSIDELSMVTFTRLRQDMAAMSL